MPKVSVYVPDELYRRAREERLPLSALTQEAIATAIRARSVDAWVEQVAGRPHRVARPIDTARLLDEVRDDFDR